MPTTTTLLREIAAFRRSLSSSVSSPITILERACDEARRLFSADGSVIEIAEPKGLVVISACGSLSDLTGALSTPSRTSLGAEWPLQQPVMFASANMKSIVTAPIEQGGTRAALTIAADRHSAFDEDAIAGLELFVAAVAAELGRTSTGNLHEVAVEERTGHLLAEVEREHQLVRLMQEIAVAANEAKTVEEAVRRSFELICRFTGWTVGHLLVVPDESPDRLVSTPIWHLGDPIRYNMIKRMSEGIDWRAGVGVPGRVLATKRPAWTDDAGKEPRLLRSNVASSHGLKSSFAFPLLSGTEVAGALEFFCQDRVDPDPRLLEIVTSIGTQLGRVIERKRSQLALATSEKRYRLLFERNLAGVFRTKLDGIVTDCNDAFAHVFGLADFREAIGRSLPSFFPSDETRDAYHAALNEQTLLTNFEVEMAKVDGTKIWVLMNVAITGEGEDRNIEGTLLDISERKEMEERVSYQAHHDPLTSLSNRAYFIDQLNRALSAARISDDPVGLLYLDLDGFKPINDALGHAAGDAILQETAERLRQCVRGSDEVGRMGGDEFTVLLSNMSKPQDAETVARKVIAAIERPFLYQEQQLHVSASMGIAIAPQDGDDADALMNAADEAMYRVKKRGRRGFGYYSAVAT